MINFLLNFLGAGIGQKIGSGISNTFSIAALIPLGVWFTKHSDDVLTTITYGNAAAFGVVLFVVVKIVQYTSPPKQKAVE